MDYGGKVVIELQGEMSDIGDFVDGLARVQFKSNIEYRLVDKGGMFVTPPNFPNVLDYSGGMIKIEMQQTFRGTIRPGQGFIRLGDR